MSEPRRPGSSKLTAENLHDYIAGRIPDPWPLVRELRDAAQKAAEGGIAAADELMTEFISKKRAAKWDIINQGLLACDKLRVVVARATAALKRREGVGT